MRMRLALALAPLAFAAGCSSTEPFEKQIRELTWRLDSAEQAAEQATVDKRLAEREVILSHQENRVLQEKLALANDAVREARAHVDETLHERLTELSETSEGEEAFSISQYGGVALESGIFFSPGKHELSSAGERGLERLVDVLSRPDYADYHFEVAGHTDADPIRRTADRYRDNHDLGAMRANSVRRFLVARGIPEERVFVSSWGPNRPFSEEKAKNRRVEIMLHREVYAVREEEPAEGAEERSKK